MLKTKHGYKKPNESNYYQNGFINLKPQETSKNQDTTNQTPHINENNSSKNNIY